MKFILFVLMACVCLVGCNPTPKIQVEPTEKGVFYVTVDDTLLPQFSACEKISTENKIKIALTAEAKDLGIPLTVHRVTNACKGGPGEMSNIWNAACSVEGVDDIDTLKCIGNTLIKISFVQIVGTRDFHILKARRCGNTGFVPAQPTPRK
jgi:uncharacterized secreted protein with C-terminal beta-propeller domain